MTGQEMTGKVDPLEKSRGIIHLILLGTLYRQLSLPRLCLEDATECRLRSLKAETRLKR